MNLLSYSWLLPPIEQEVTQWYCPVWWIWMLSLVTGRNHCSSDCRPLRIGNCFPCYTHGCHFFPASSFLFSSSPFFLCHCLLYHSRVPGHLCKCRPLACWCSPSFAQCSQLCFWVRTPPCPSSCWWCMVQAMLGTVYPPCASIFQQRQRTLWLFVRLMLAVVHLVLVLLSMHYVWFYLFKCRDSRSCLMTSASPSPSSLSSAGLPGSEVSNSLSTISHMCCWKSM